LHARNDDDDDSHAALPLQLFNPFIAMKKNSSYARGILVKIKSFFPYVETVEMG